MNEQKQSFWDIKTVILTALCFLWGIVSVFILFSQKTNTESDLNFEMQQELASTLSTQKLYIQSVAIYIRLADNNSFDRNKKANINYIIAKIYMDDLKDYDNALLYFYKSKMLNPEKTILEEIDRKIVNALELSGRSSEAQEEMDKATALVQSSEKKSDGSAIIASVGDRNITLNEFKKALNDLPPYMKDQFKTKEKKTEFLHQYLSKELLLESARRKGLDKDPKINEKIAQLKKEYIVQSLIEEEVGKNVQLSDSEIKLYYETHKDEFKDKKEKGKEKQRPFDESKQQVEEIVYKQKYEQAYKNFMMNLQKTQQVKIFDAAME